MPLRLALLPATAASRVLPAARVHAAARIPAASRVLTALALAAALPIACTSPAASPELPATTGPTLDVLTYNVNFEQFDVATVDAILDADADLVFLQETTPRWEAALRQRLAARYPTIELRHADAPDGGMGILARGSVETTAWLPSPVGAFPAWCVTVETPLGPLRALHVHLHPPLDEGGLFTGYFTTGDDRRAEMEAFLECFGAAPDLAVGDFNEGEGEAVDLVESAGLRDAASAFPPPLRTWSWQTRFGELEGRPDHVFAGPALVPRRVEVIEAGGSDHRPLRVQLTRAAP